MITEIDKLRDLLSENNTERVLRIIKEGIENYPDNLKLMTSSLSARREELENNKIMGVLDFKESSKIQNEINIGLFGLISNLEKINNSSEPPGEESAEPVVKATTGKSVFISYNHEDKAVADRLKEKLTAENIKVVIDSDSMLPGDNIQKFIEKCVRESATTISLISKNSLLSAWVAMESINTIYAEKTENSKSFIGCYITKDFFNAAFTDEALDHIEAEIKKKRELVKSRFDKDRSTVDLENDLNRQIDLRNNLPKIIQRFKESLCIDISDENMDTGIQKIVQKILS